MTELVLDVINIASAVGFVILALKFKKYLEGEW